ncbi:MAG: tripartite tricarboxylate transporter substrate binding protein [Chromatiaceae bacterium]|nr:tripartite tricarboxylate transporter substrate binding protein [Gammaproteobacteria bacterium]MCP5312947.1 tripartite tricarboxylate transporter substrate binding protein [Chromatiaceae bacterium]
MKRFVQKLAVSAAAVVAGVSFAAGSAMAEYPDRPISVIVSYGAGGATDFQARIVTMMSAKEDKDGKGVYLNGQPMVIVNRPGAGGQVGWNKFVQQAKADGYELAAYNVPHFIAQSIVFPKKVKYNIDNLEPIANWGADPAVLIVNKDSPFNSLKDYLDYAKANPGKLTVSGAGLYVGHHIANLQLDKAAGVETKYVPSGGGVKAMQFVLGGQTMAGFNNLSDAYRNRDRLKILAIADLERNEFLPDVPTFKEQGVDVDDSSVNFRGIMAPGGTPEPVLTMLADKVPAMFQDSKVIGKMKEGGSPMRVMNRAQVQKMWKERQAYLTDLLKDLRQEN